MIVHVFKLRVGVHFGQNVVKNNNFIKKCCEQKLLRIGFLIRNLVDACLSGPEVELGGS